ncbi:uroporphyrinogen-III synthase [Devosia sp. YIM 151766]|uniref:uroporphyrinogen-III synthase n=1 Tax=Devosia sp. YIM 151766 TaxID=3017325 RepID=UPI00255C289E|nr:uroporphyrinogen-III synthase [Devosia sp. YIM 151766]WIY52766.1 uroporphyrinogen-III synthase [Devosia sp. YIM 151766]
MMRMLVTRPEPDAQATQERLAALGIPSAMAPLMTRQTLAANLPMAEGFAAIAFTSTNALRGLADLEALSPFLTTPAFAVGDRTAHEARQLGFVSVTPADGTLGSLVTTIALARLAGPVFYPAGKHLSGDLAHALAPHGLMVVTTPVYEMVAESRLDPEIAAALSAEDFGAVLFYSRRTAEIFCALAAANLTDAQRRRLPMLCLSENVAAPLIDNRFSRILLADHPSEEAMMALALAFAREQTGP